MTGPFAAAAMLAAAVGLAASCAGAVERAAPAVTGGEPAAAGREQRVVQLLQRRPRLEDGRLQPSAVPAALDAALTIYTGEELPLDALATLVPESGAVWIVDHGGAAGPGPVARALAGRARLLVEDPASVELVDPARIASASSPPATILRVARPGWRDGAYDDSLGDVRHAHEPAGPLIVDLFDVGIGDGTWRADALLVGDPDAALVAARIIVTARATGALPDAADVERVTGIDPRRIVWERVALAD